MMQFANVRWNGEVSSVFTLSNGVRQGGVISAILYCFYTNDLFRLLRNRSKGCWVNSNFHGIFGYSDDNILMAPSLSALQDMLRTCEQYALEHNLKFSTDPNPKKCKTKCLAFLSKPRPLQNLQLCGHPLPWVDHCKHLGNTVEHRINGLKQDMAIKRASYIAKNNELLQEFYFAHPRTKIKLNNIYNTHFTGSPLWDLFCDEAIKFENTWNRSVRIMYDLPVNTHRYFIEPLVEGRHFKNTVIKRFLRFVENIQKSTKVIPKMLLHTIKLDVKSITGSNLREIMLLVNKSSIGQLNIHDADVVQYHKIKEEDTWKISVLKEITDIKFENLCLDGFSSEELEEILYYIATS